PSPAPRERVASPQGEPGEGSLPPGKTLTLPALRAGPLPLPRCGRGVYVSGIAGGAPNMVPTGSLISEDLTLAPSPRRRRDTSTNPPWAWIRTPSGPADTTSPSFLPRTAPKVAAMIVFA